MVCNQLTGPANSKDDTGGGHEVSMWCFDLQEIILSVVVHWSVQGRRHLTVAYALTGQPWELLSFFYQHKSELKLQDIKK